MPTNKVLSEDNNLSRVEVFYSYKLNDEIKYLIKEIIEIIGQKSFKMPYVWQIFDSKKELKDHIDENHRLKDHIAVSSITAEIIAIDILSSNDGILSTSVRDDKGRLLAVKFKESFKKALLE